MGRSAFSEGYPGEGGARLSHYTQDGENDWDQTFDDRQDVFPTGVQSLSDGYIVLLVHLWKDSTFVMKLSQDGREEWTCHLPFAENEGPSAVRETSKGYLLYLTGEDSRRTGIYGSVDRDGNLVRSLQFQHDVNVWDAQFTGEGEMILAGYRSIDGDQGAAFEEWDAYGEARWQKRLNGEGEEGFSAFSPCEDGGYILLEYFMDEDYTGGALILKVGEQNRGTPSRIPLPSDIRQAGSL